MLLQSILVEVNLLQLKHVLPRISPVFLLNKNVRKRFKFATSRSLNVIAEKLKAAAATEFCACVVVLHFDSPALLYLYECGRLPHLHCTEALKGVDRGLLVHLADSTPCLCFGTVNNSHHAVHSSSSEASSSTTD